MKVKMKKKVLVKKKKGSLKKQAAPAAQETVAPSKTTATKTRQVADIAPVHLIQEEKQVAADENGASEDADMESDEEGAASTGDNDDIDEMDADDVVPVEQKNQQKGGSSSSTGSSSKVDSNESENAKQDIENATFASLGVCPELCQAVEVLGWKQPTEIQRVSIPPALEGRDIIALAETGSGKTGAFALPIVQALLDKPQRFFCVALSPTRELCVQIGEQFKALGAAISLQVCVILGGVDMVTQAQQLAQRPHVVVASPGRLVDHLENTKGFHLRTLQYLVMDEADRLLSEDFEEALDKISLVANPKERKTYLFSATMTSKVAKLQRACLKKPVKLEVSSKYGTAKGLIQNYLFQPLKYKAAWFVALVNHFSNYSMMVFSDTCKETHRMASILRELGFSAVALHGQMPQVQRLGALNQFKSGQKKILIATDVASRGLDIPSVDVVINLDIPKNSKDYVHRVGRTARAGRAGRAITFVTQYDVEGFQKIENSLGKKLPELQDVREEQALAFHDRVQAACRKVDLAEREEREEGGGKGKKKMLQHYSSKKHRGKRK
ncbi:unnamed protein product [Amoebophrya sp. A120]|nr:unnamed protein product [Amoebophrya sp. A120]|eukprot:GSA120T00011537001.1